MAWPLSLQEFLRIRQSRCQQLHCLADLRCRLPKLELVRSVGLRLLEAVAYALEEQELEGSRLFWLQSVPADIIPAQAQLWRQWASSQRLGSTQASALEWSSLQASSTAQCCRQRRGTVATMLMAHPCW